jgi:hypothetical protein
MGESPRNRPLCPSPIKPVIKVSLKRLGAAAEAMPSIKCEAGELGKQALDKIESVDTRGGPRVARRALLFLGDVRAE